MAVETINLKLIFFIPLCKSTASVHPSVCLSYLSIAAARAALTGKHNTLVCRAPGWQGAPDGQQAKKLVVTKCLFYIINVLI